MDIKAYAKLNLILNVGGLREDGNHEVETLYCAINLYDLVSVNRAEKDSIAMSFPDLEKDIYVSPKNNLAIKALNLMRESFYCDEAYSIEIEKYIPLSGGLAGGSADAAGVIALLANMWDIKECDKLYEIAARLGSDVPFCLAALYNHTWAIGRGRGEILEFVSPQELGISLKFSDIFLPKKTPTIYKSLKEEDNLVKYSVSDFLAAKKEDKQKFCGNGLSKAAEKYYGKAPEGYILCGAGPTYFKISEEGEYRTI